MRYHNTRLPTIFIETLRCDISSWPLITTLQCALHNDPSMCSSSWPPSLFINVLFIVNIHQDPSAWPLITACHRDPSSRRVNVLIIVTPHHDSSKCSRPEQALAAASKTLLPDHFRYNKSPSVTRSEGPDVGGAHQIMSVTNYFICKRNNKFRDICIVYVNLCKFIRNGIAIDHYNNLSDWEHFVGWNQRQAP